MVCHAVEDRDVPQDPQAGVQGGGVETANREAAGELGVGHQHPQLASILDHRDEPYRARCPTGSRIHGTTELEL